MAKCGFISNRLFDAAASGARVISDEVEGIMELFDGAVQTYKTPAQLAALISPSGLTSFGSPEHISERARRIGTANSFNERVDHLIAAAQKVINHNADN
jgi:spore maturation protein CgeB